MSNNVGEGKPNWLSDAIGECFQKTDWPKLIERKTRNCIVEAIKSNPKGQDMAKHPQLDDAITRGLHVARETKKRIDDLERDGKKPACPSPAWDAADTISKMLNIPLD